MKFKPNKCPTCGEDAAVVMETVPARAQLQSDGDGGYEYAGSSEICWDGQHMELDESNLAELYCENEHEWSAVYLGEK